MSQQENASSELVPGANNKMAPIPQGARIQKRPLTRRQLPASSKTPVIYVSSNSPFMSVVKRARKFLDKDLRTVVTVMGTGKAIEKTLNVASWFQQQGDCVVEIKTRTIGTVDDVVTGDADDAFGADNESRLRKLNCLEVAISLK
ncbi:rpp20 subunit of nuclear RNase MRP and P domain-containing protein [Trichoderma breve]|uniref:Rpp20 subunit of nuclear RNase MRP and P domain-containing protein n=1 Tax=Trichoderma breve TaxID=2034170 RepID=A0A9W9E2Z3_9HYPO|nr:rpp20 subunit of nuclear RNase MRP and P domain-containing protein [Trichoderma breve]KAJ4857013.1 rpp20 subunit of nuclear RNase MRP and P domain-containing protein [Trichoderma breve]